MTQKEIQHEFLKNLWHTDDEMPESGKPSLSKAWNGTTP